MMNNEQKRQGQLWWLNTFARARATVGREYPPRHTELILLKPEWPLFSILHYCNPAIQEQAKMAYLADWYRPRPASGVTNAENSW